MRSFKKIILIITLMFAFIATPKAISKPEITNHEKIKVYIFRGDGCSHCHEFLEYFGKNAHEYADYFEIVAFESWNDVANVKLRNKVNEYFEIKNTDNSKIETSVPLIIIGNWHTFGFDKNSNDSETIINKALAEYQNANYEDVVNKLITEEELEPNPETLKEACDKEQVDYIDSNNVNTNVTQKKNGVALLIIFGILIGGFGIVIFLAKK